MLQRDFFCYKILRMLSTWSYQHIGLNLSVSGRSMLFLKLLHFVIILMAILAMPIHSGFQYVFHFTFSLCQFQCSLFNFLVGSHVITFCSESSLLFRASFPWAILWDLWGKVIVIEAKGIELGLVCGTESAFVGKKKKVVAELTCFLAHLNCACHAWMEANKKFSVEMRYKENRSLKKCQTAAKVQFCWMLFPLRVLLMPEKLLYLHPPLMPLDVLVYGSRQTEWFFKC